MNEAATWYAELVKPSWAPPAWLFGPAWTVLYAIIIVTFGTVFVLALRREIPRRTVIPFVLNLIANIAYSPIQFTLKNNVLASLDILIVLGTIVWMIVAIAPHRRWIAWAQAPYVAWVTFATCLQLTITYLNDVR